MNNNCELHVSPRWRDALAGVGLDTFDSMSNFDGGQCVSIHNRSVTYRVDLPDGRVVFLKRDVFTMVKEIWDDLRRLRKPEPLTIKERRAIDWLIELEIIAPEVIALGQRRRMLLPWRGVMITAQMPGTPLDQYIPSAPEQARISAVEAIGAAVARMFQARMYWPDLYARHIHVMDDGRIGMLDVERLDHCSKIAGLVRKTRRRVQRFSRELTKLGAGDDEQEALSRGLDIPDVFSAKATRT